MTTPKIAIVCDWLVTYAGAEKVLEQMLKCFPKADLFSVVDFIKEPERGFILNKPVKTTWVQNLPFAKRKYRSYLPLMPVAIKSLDVSAYDIVISSSHAVAKGIKTTRKQVHICYIHSPMRYAWDLRAQYLRESGLDHGLKGWLANSLLNYLQAWDKKNSKYVDHFIANSNYIKDRVERAYARESSVIYPPVDLERFVVQEQKQDYYVTAARMVPYKKINLIVQAFAAMPDKKMKVIGTGPDYDKIAKLVTPNIELLGYQKDESLVQYLQSAKAFAFAAEEDFGILPVEAMACGTPVIAFGKGGALETVVGLNDKKPTGCFFQEQTVQSICKAVELFECNQDKILAVNCRAQAEKFAEDVFRQKLIGFVEKVCKYE